MTSVLVTEEGDIKFIYDEEVFKDLRYEDNSTIYRASYVEPVGHSWQVDFSPIGGPVLPHLFDSRSEALATEKVWLEENYLK